MFAQNTAFIGKGSYSLQTNTTSKPKKKKKKYNWEKLKEMSKLFFVITPCQYNLLDLQFLEWRNWSQHQNKKARIYKLLTSLDVWNWWLKLCQIEVYKVLIEISHELTNYFWGLRLVRAPAKSQTLCYIYLIRYTHDFYCESGLSYEDSKINNTIWWKF